MSIQPLSEVLQEILTLNQKLQNLSVQKKDVLIVGDMNKLSQIVQQESQLIKRLGKLEENRQAAVEHLVNQLNLDKHNDLTFSDILSQIKEPADKQRLEGLHQELVTTLNHVQQLNDTNQQLLQQSLDFVNYSIELLTEDPNEQVYQKPVQVDHSTYSKPKRNFFDTKA